jgi:hypothetical protein
MLGDHLEVRLRHDEDDDDARFVTLRGVGRAWAARWERIEAAIAPWRVRETPC